MPDPRLSSDRGDVVGVIGRSEVECPECGRIAGTACVATDGAYERTDHWRRLEAEVAWLREQRRGAVEALRASREHIAAWSPHPDHATRTLLARIDAALSTARGQ